MAIVIFNQALQTATGETQLEIQATSFRELKSKLQDRYPALTPSLLQGAVAIDGEIIPDPLLEQLPEKAEVHFIPRIEGG